jgi:hypothetical protein
VLPPCRRDDPPALIYAYNADLDMDILMTCSSMGGVPRWRSVLTMGGVIFDGSTISAIIAAIGSGLPGMYVLRLRGKDQTFQIPQLKIQPYQDVRIVSTATGSSKLKFTSSVTLATDAKLAMSGRLAIDMGILMFAMHHSINAGTVTFGGSALTLFGPAAAWRGAVHGSLPGTVTIQPPAGGQRLTISRSGSGAPSVSPKTSILAFGWTATKRFPNVKNANNRGFALYRMAAVPKGTFDGTVAGADKYKAICAAAGLRTVGSGYISYSQNCARWGCVTVAKDGSWGSSSDVEDYIRSKTGWSVPVLIHGYSDGYPWGYDDCSSKGASCWRTTSFVPICGLEI